MAPPAGPATTFDGPEPPCWAILGELPDIIEAALNHTAIRSRLAASFFRSRYRPQVAVALQGLADALDGITDSADRM